MDNSQLVPSGYKRTEVGVIPEDWYAGTLDDLTPFVTSGSRGWAKYYADYGSAFLRITNLSRESIYLNLEDLKVVNLPSTDKEGSRTQLQNGDLLISITADVGIIGYIDFSVPKPAYINQHIALVRFDADKANQKYLAYFLASTTAQQVFRSATDQGAKTGMNLMGIRAIQVVFPPLPEQRAIAEALNDVDALIAALDRLIAKKRAIKQGAMQRLLTGKTRLPGFSGAWEAGKLEDLCVLITKGTTPTSLGKNFTDRGINFIKIESLTTDGRILLDRVAFIDEETHSLLKRSQLESNDILFSIAGALGRTAIVTPDLLPANTNQALALIRLRDQTHLDRAFLLRYLRGPQIAQHIESINVQAAQANLSLANIRDFEIKYPSLPEQRAIATVLSDMDAEIAVLEQRRDKTRAIKQGMMQALLTGRIRLIQPSSSP